MNNYIIRLATLKDAKNLSPLFDQLGYPSTENELELRLNYYINNEHYGLAVAVDNERLIGWIAWSVTKLIVSDKNRIHIEGLVVDSDYQAKGIGKMLMRFVEDFAKNYKSCIIDLTSGIRRAKDGTHDFYKKLGYNNEGHMAKLYLRKEI